jgi:hypothetical protein
MNIIRFKRSFKNTSIDALSAGEPNLHLGGVNGSVMQFIGNASNQPILINTPPFSFLLSKTLSPSVIINNGKSYNLMTSLTALDVLEATTINFTYIKTGFSYNKGNISLAFPPFKDYTDYKIRVQLKGKITGVFCDDRQFTLDLRRGADNSLVLQDHVVTIHGHSLDGLTRLYTSFVNGLSDPFITGGLRIVLNNNSSTSITLTGFSFLIQGICTNFIQ